MVPLILGNPHIYLRGTVNTEPLSNPGPVSRRGVGEGSAAGGDSGCSSTSGLGFKGLGFRV